MINPRPFFATMSAATTVRFLCKSLSGMLLCAAALMGHAEENSCKVSYEDLDWVAKEKLSPEQQKSLTVGCCGVFVEPTGTLPVGDMAAEGEITISGTSSQITKQSTIMTGDVVLTQGTRKITGDNAELFNQPQGVNLEGNVSFREPGFLLRGDKAAIDLENNTLDVQDARYVLHAQRIHGTAANIKRDSGGVIKLLDSTYSSCTPGNEVWYLKSSTLELDTINSQGKATNVRVNVLDVPVFYFPYLLFPIGNQRFSGFLAPSFSHSESGFDITLPYYLNLAPDYDATIIPRYLSDRGTQLGGEFRHLSPLFNSSISAAYLPDDDVTGTDRWVLGLKQDGGKYQPWSTLVDITRVSDKDYFEDLDNSGLSVSRNTHLKQLGKAGYMTDNWTSYIEVEDYQTLRTSALTDPYEKLPELNAVGDYYLGSGFSTRLDQTYTQFDHRDTTQITGDRIITDYQLGWRHDSAAAFIAPAVHLHYLEQHLENTAADSNPAVTVMSAGLDMGLILLREGAHYSQTLEPRLYHYYADYENQDAFHLFDTDEMEFDYAQLYRDYRFAGNDRIGDADQTSVGVASRWLDQDSGKEIFMVGVGQIFYHEDRRVTAFDPVTFALLPTEVQDHYTRNRSPIASELQWFFAEQWRLSAGLAWSEEARRTDNGNVFVHYQGDNDTLFSVGYRYRQLLSRIGPVYMIDTVQQGDISGYWPLSNQWALVGRSNYDFTNHRSLETLAGFQYEDCCWRLRTVYRQWASNPDDIAIADLQQNNNGIYLEIQFKNLAGLGTKTSSMLRDSIYGYDKKD